MQEESRADEPEKPPANVLHKAPPVNCMLASLNFKASVVIVEVFFGALALNFECEW